MKGGVRTCKLCGQQFQPVTANQQYCSQEHFDKCVICGQPFRITHTYHKATCGCKACVQKYREQTNLERFGDANPARVDAIKEKQAQTCLDRYGVSTPFLMEDFRFKSVTTSRAKYGTDAPMQSEYIKAKHRRTVREHFGVDTPTEIPHVRSAMMNMYENSDRVKEIVRKRVNTSSCEASDGVHLNM